MPVDNLQRMIQLAEDFFEAKGDPSQISVTPEILDRLKQIHPDTVSEESEQEGPIAWILLVPTTRNVMDAFLGKSIGEQELLDRTRPGEQYEAIYLCSALVLPEHRGRGLARRLVVKGISSIRNDHDIASLYYWAFSPEGEKLAASAARDCGLPLFARTPD